MASDDPKEERDEGERDFGDPIAGVVPPGGDAPPNAKFCSDRVSFDARLFVGLGGLWADSGEAPLIPSRLSVDEDEEELD